MTVTQYTQHAPGEAPPKPVRVNGVQQFVTQAEPTPFDCPDGMIYDHATGECVAEEAAG